MMSTDTYERAADRVARTFPDDVSHHELLVEHDSGCHRTLLATAPGTGMYHFTITTWPYQLAVSGDMGTFVYHHYSHEDMFTFFTPAPGRPAGEINPQYWAEKVAAFDRNCRGSGKRFERELAKTWLRQQVASWNGPSRGEKAEVLAELEYATGDEHELMSAVWNFSLGKFRFETDDGFPEWFDWDHHLLWSMHAIVWTLPRYTELKKRTIRG